MDPAGGHCLTVLPWCAWGWSLALNLPTFPRTGVPPLTPHPGRPASTPDEMKPTLQTSQKRHLLPPAAATASLCLGGLGARARAEGPSPGQPPALQHTPWSKGRRTPSPRQASLSSSSSPDCQYPVPRPPPGEDIRGLTGPAGETLAPAALCQLQAPQFTCTRDSLTPLTACPPEVARFPPTVGAPPRVTVPKDRWGLCDG